jgi:RNA binding exosome subunit
LEQGPLGKKDAAMAQAMPRRRTKPRIDREKVKEALRRAFRKEFPQDTVDVSDGYAGNIHVMVVSRRFDKLSERKKQDMMWTIVGRSGLTEEDKRLISLLYPVSVVEIK